MPKIRCDCDHVISLSDIPSPNQLLIISDVEFERFFESEAGAEEIYAATTLVAKCSNCGRLHIYWNGFGSMPTTYKIDVLGEIDESEAASKDNSNISDSPSIVYQNNAMNKTIGIVLLALGIIMLVWTGFTYTKKEKVIDAGPIQISADKQHTVNWPPYAGCILIVGGIVLMLAGKKR